MSHAPRPTNAFAPDRRSSGSQRFWLYDAVVTGGRGFWAVVIPGVICERTPLFNERDRLSWVEGAVLPLREAIGVAA